jgi:uncharacterized protein
MKTGIKLLSVLILALLSAGSVSAQMEYPFYGAKDVFDWEMVRKDSFGVYVTVPADTTKIVYLSREKKLYRLYDRNNNLLEEGPYKLVGDKQYGRTGQWSVYYPGGRLRSQGYYENDKSVGLWRQYYAVGKLMRLASYGLIEVKGKKYYDMIGAYQEYYENGQLKVNGFYKAAFDTSFQDMVYEEDPKTHKGKVTASKGEIPHSHQSGTWYYYKENGELDKMEEH